MFLTNWWKIFAKSSTQYAGKTHAAEGDERAFFRCVILAILMISSSPLMAKDALHNEIIQFDIPRQQADMSLIKFAEQADLTLIVPFDQVREITTNRLVGRYPIEEALELLLSGTELEANVGESIRITFVSDQDQGNKMNTKKGFLAAMMGVLFGSTQATGVVAAVDQGSGSNSSYGLEEIIVTAQKRSESLQDIPINVLSLTGADLDNSSIVGVQELVARVPGLVVNSFGGQGQAYMRGIGNEIQGPGVDPAIAIYVDGLYQPRAAGALQSMLDVERIEVLKGPQGILYGRNATGGAINIVSKSPAEEFTGNISAAIGNYHASKIAASISGPLNDNNTIKGRLSAVKNDHDGYMRIVNLGTDGDYLESLAVRGILEFNPEDNLTVTLSGWYTDDTDGSTYHALNLGTNPTVQVFGGTVFDNPRRVIAGLKSENQREIYGAIAKIQWDLEALSLTSITGFQKSDWDWKSFDADGSEIPIVENGGETPYIENTDYISQEFILNSSEDSKLSWTALMTIGQEKGDAISSATIGIADLNVEYGGATETKTFGVAGQVTYSVTDKLSVIGGARWSYEKKEVDRIGINTILSSGDKLIIGPTSDKGSFNAFTPRAGVQYILSDEIMLYLTASKGFKSGGYNVYEAETPFFEEEEVVSYEVGSKMLLLDRRLLANLNFFLYDYKDMQVNRFQDFQSYVTNAAESTVYGADVDLIAQLDSGLRLEANLAFLHARFDDFVSSNPTFPEQGDLNRKGNPLSRAPNFTASLAAEYSWQTDANSTMTLRGEYYHRDKIYFTPFKDELTSVGAIDLWNARLSWVSPNELWTVTLYGNNLTDKEYVASMITLQSLYGQQGYYNAPRTYGLSVGYDF